MHEFGIISSVLDTVFATASRAHATKVLAVTLRIGAMTQAQDESLQFAYDILTQDSIAQDSRLLIEHVTPGSHCLDCHQDFDHNGRDLRCPFCGSVHTQLTRGRELAIASIDVDIPDDIAQISSTQQPSFASTSDVACALASTTHQDWPAHTEVAARQERNSKEKNDV